MLEPLRSRRRRTTARRDRCRSHHHARATHASRVCLGHLGLLPWLQEFCGLFSRISTSSSTTSQLHSLHLWLQEFCGLLKNPMSLRAFPFDTDFIEVFIHQAEASTRDDYIFRPFDVRHSQP